MTLRLPDHWVWDIWLADDGEQYHLFFLRASRALHDPGRRHHRASIGHAVSRDLRAWELLPDALVAADHDDWDDLATWTGSVVRGPQKWMMYYTGVSRGEKGLIQRIGLATSDDLVTWHRHPANPVAEADARWYEKLDLTSWFDEAWRDPWVFADPGGDGWHMLVTARAATGPADGRGVIGHLRSHDMVSWEARPPLTEPSGFGHLEVPQVEIVDGRAVLVFSCMPGELGAERTERAGGVWTAPGASLLGPYDIRDQARLVQDRSLYSGRLIRDRDERWQLLGFVNHGDDGSFVGEVCDPIPVTYIPGRGLVEEGTHG
ncbi:family 43 glycosylhydrolase [Streptosporangium longisporum]|uniref:beta-fructofuranosidase n=1 Tax=Streptosporangium longisporum TaxID=46187 RepID=A0ABP6KEL7_9ACTN